MAAVVARRRRRRGCRGGCRSPSPHPTTIPGARTRRASPTMPPMATTRGFFGRRARDPRLPPGQYDAGDAVAGAQRRGHAEAVDGHVDVHGRGSGRASDDVDLGRDPRPRAVDVRGRHPLRHDVVEVRHDVRRRLRRHAAGGRRPAARAPPTSSPSATPATRRTSRSPTSPAARRGSSGTSTARRCPSTTAARPGCSCPTCTSGRAPSGWPACACSTTTSRGSGSATATTTAATRGSSSATRATDGRTAGRGGRPRSLAVTGRDAAGQDVPAGPARAVAPPRRPARRRAPDRAGRLHGPALVLGGLGARRHRRARADRRAARRRRGVDVPPRRRRARRRAGGPRPARRVVRVGRDDARRCSSAAAPASCR